MSGSKTAVTAAIVLFVLLILAAGVFSGKGRVGKRSSGEDTSSAETGTVIAESDVIEQPPDESSGSELFLESSGADSLASALTADSTVIPDSRPETSHEADSTPDSASRSDSQPADGTDSSSRESSDDSSRSDSKKPQEIPPSDPNAEPVTEPEEASAPDSSQSETRSPRSDSAIELPVLPM